jgi:hypothetical protein
MSDVASTVDEVNQLPLKALALKPGMALQTRRLADGATKIESQYFGAIEGKGVMVGPLGAEGSQTEMVVGDVCVVRGFTGQYEYSFLTKVLQTFEKPFVYAMLAYPSRVDARLVRQSMRTRVSWPSKVRVVGSKDVAQAVTLIDLSMSGAMIKSPSGLAPISSELQLSISAQLEQTPFELVVTAKICHNNRAADENVHFIGMAFVGLSAQDKLVLQYITSKGAAAE